MVPVLMTREMDYALRVLRALHQNGQQSAAAIAQREHMPKAITLKLLKRLRAAGLVDSRWGPGGGYLLQRSCGELYLGDLFQALEEPVFVNRCQQPGYRCENRSDEGCSLCRELSRIQLALNEELHKTPLSEIFQNP